MGTAVIPNGCIVVGVDGSESADRAVEWAAAQATLEHRPLVVMHGAEHMAHYGFRPELAGIDHRVLVEAVERDARAVVTAAEKRAHAAAPDIDVRTAMVDTDPRQALVDASETAHLVVLGSRGRGPLLRVVLGSVSVSVARHAHCPVVVCRPRDEPADEHGVLVGADGTSASVPVLEFAFQQASLRGLPLTVMHCFWDVGVATTGSGVVPHGSADDVEELRLLLAESVAGLGAKYLDVDVDLQLARGLVDDCLTAQAPAAELLVVGRTAEAGWSRFLHASCAMAVLERARTTVVVVPEPHEEGSYR